MDKSRSYYRLVYKRFGHKEVRLQQADHEELGGEADIATITVKEKEDNELINNYAKSVWNRRNAKVKLHENIIDFYKQVIWQVKPKTIKKYILIVTQFMIFSPTLDPKVVPRFLEFKFTEESFDTNSKQSKSSTIRQYITHIKRFLYILNKDMLNEYSDLFSKYNLIKTTCIHPHLLLKYTTMLIII